MCKIILIIEWIIVGLVILANSVYFIKEYLNIKKEKYQGGIF
jgi:hypothetical protein